jgi:hypothetical protein
LSTPTPSTPVPSPTPTATTTAGDPTGTSPTQAATIIIEGLR